MAPTDNISLIIKFIDKMDDVDDIVTNYLKGYLRDADTLIDEGINGVESFVTDLLESLNIDEIIIKQIIDLLLEYWELDIEPRIQDQLNDDSEGIDKLKAPFKMSNQITLSATHKLSMGGVDLESTARKKIVSQVDTKKLARAERKLLEKHQKKTQKSLYEASKIVQDQADEEERLRLISINPVLDYTVSRGKAKDIKVENFDISLAGKRILTDSTLTLAYGRRYGLIGKSTLLRTVSQRDINIPTHISILHVEQEIVGDETTAIQSVLKADIFREHLLREEREFNEKLLTETDDGVKEEISNKLKEVYTKLEDIESEKAESKAAAILNGLGFTNEQFDFSTKTFSGGWRMRLALARALFCKPDLLLLDEPTNMLDIPAVIWLERYLQTWENTLLVVSHDRDEVATDIIHQHSEKLDYYKGNFSSFYSTKGERAKNQLKEYEAQLQQRKHLQDFIDRWRFNAKRAPQAQSKIKILEKMPILEKPVDESLVSFTFPDPDPISPPILQMDDVTFGYSVEKVQLKGVNIDMQLDSRCAVVGPNGAGKSTMLKLLIGTLEPQSGIVNRHGRLRVGYFTQHHVDQLNLELNSVAQLHVQFPGKKEEEYRKQLGQFGITGTVALQPISTLSGGQKSRVAFAALALQYPHILVLDEPTNHLDMESMDALIRAIDRFKGGVVVVSHDERFLSMVADQLWVCDKNVLTKFDGTIKDYKKLLADDIK